MQRFPPAGLLILVALVTPQPVRAAEQGWSGIQREQLVEAPLSEGGDQAKPALIRRAEQLEREGNTQAAADLVLRVLAINETTLGPDHEDTAVSLNKLAELYRAQGRYGEAEPLYKRSLAIIEKALGPEHPHLATSLNNLALLYARQGRYSEAEPLYRRTLAIYEKTQGPEHPYTATSLNNLAALYASQGRFAEAEPLHLRSLAISETVLGPEHPDTATSLNNLAALYRDQARYGEAEPLYKRTVAIYEKVLGLEHPDLATSLSNLALLYSSQGRYGEAELLLKRALAIRETVLGPEHPDTATGLNNLAELYRDQARYSEAEPLYKRTVAIYEKALGAEHPLTATSLNNLGLVYASQGRFGEAESLQLRSLAISETVLGPEHPDTGVSLNNLALLYVNQGRYKQAKRLYRRALSISERVLGAENPATANGLNNLALLLLQLGEVRSASALIGRLSRSQLDWLRRELPLQPRELRSSLIGAQPDALGSTFALLDRDASSAALALETRLNRQGLLAEIEQRQRLLLGSSGQTRRLGERLGGLDRQLASITLTRGQRQELRSQRQQLEGELNRLLPALRLEPVSSLEVARALRGIAARGLLVEFQNYRPWVRQGSGAGGWGEPHYVALLLHADGRIAAISLGEAGPIDAAIERAHGASAANQADAASLWGQVSALVLNPLERELQGVRELFVSPDGELHRVAYAALPAPGGGQRLLSEAFELRVLTTGRDLIRLQLPGRAGGAAVLIANPDYNARRRPGSGAQVSRRVWDPLPGTEREARVLAPLLGVSATISGAAATAGVVMELQGPRVLHIATHGFFQSDPDPSSRPGDEEDALLRSGLVLAGANHPQADGSDDGYLTAAEVTGINLQGTQLVTLSACQSGLGDLKSGEGVYGLQRSLAVAGARGTLLSLWKVDDEATRAFMEGYYRRLVAGEGSAAALAGTQAAFRTHANELYRDVYVWGAFQLIGDWRGMGSRR